jgi:lysyl-tRNA synthetase class II
MNPETRRVFEIRSRFIRHVRAFLDNRGYMEVETPVSEHHFRRRDGTGHLSPITTRWI